MKNKPNFFFDNRGFPNWGDGGGLPLGNFSHIILFFSDRVPKHKFHRLRLDRDVVLKMWVEKNSNLLCYVQDCRDHMRVEPEEGTQDLCCWKCFLMSWSLAHTWKFGFRNKSPQVRQSFHFFLTEKGNLRVEDLYRCKYRIMIIATMRCDTYTYNHMEAKVCWDKNDKWW